MTLIQACCLGSKPKMVLIVAAALAAERDVHDCKDNKAKAQGQ